MNEAGFKHKWRRGALSFCAYGQKKYTRLKASTLGDGYGLEDIQTIKAIADARASILSTEHVESISNYLSNWDAIRLGDKRIVVSSLIHRIQATSENIRIEWRV